MYDVVPAYVALTTVGVLAVLHRLPVSGEDLIYYAEDCDACSYDYLEETVVGDRPIFYNIGLEHVFASEGYITDVARDYAARAIVQPGVVHAVLARWEMMT